ncbi:hypothetical protein CHLNCDRAFT_136214 [Chlorella variabilis]|uniref:ABC1 atypical kinase-like domain-containing protein n=1 Tax=Chlorella variabilis TaxID=554065 RepID=E1ZJ84_CHLVA|nr:hypothetical protein CHLNCDRAFT_136214 [Chlorella variabilis]EFN54091.1 hypothetical protein CHLNCDRAFT_136214 [Chlorella variabilis]|eukprot:XP_005846193.1 hypothetical protein CHLNCDRAFT_136214 [Chlorella variabilis]
MRRAAGSQLRGLRLAGELLAAEASTSGRGAATGAAACAGAGSGGSLVAACRGLHLAPASRWLRQPAPGWQTAAAGGAKPLPRPRLRAEFGTRASRRGRGGTGLPPAAAAAAAAAAGWAGGAYLPSRWAAARRQLAQRLEWVLGRGYHAREAFFNAVYMQPNWSKSLLLLLAERVTRGDPRFAWCYSTPVAESEEQLCEQPAEEGGSLSALQRARRAAASLLRLACLLALFAPVVLTAPLVGDFLGISRARWLRLLRWTLERAGPAFIKWGQWAATRHDLFPPDFCSELELLHTQPAVLVETFEAGTHISAYVARGAGAPHNSELAKLGARTMLHMMIVDNLIHADLHPGNILVTLDWPFGGANRLVRLGRRLAVAAGLQGAVDWLDGWQRAKLVLLDAGMAMRLTPEDQRNMFGLFEAFAEMDGSRLAHWALRFSGEEQSCPDPAAFVSDVASFFERLTAESAATGATHGADALAEVLELVRTHAVNMPGHICATVVTTMVLEGWSNKLDPNHSTLQGERAAAPQVKRMVKATKGGLLGQLTEVMMRGELAADSEVMERVVLLEPALVRV